MYYEIALSNLKNKIATKKKYNEATLKKGHFKLTNADWTSVYNDLNAEIRLRHYSSKTLRSYRGWVSGVVGVGVAYAILLIFKQDRPKNRCFED